MGRRFGRGGRSIGGDVIIVKKVDVGKKGGSDHGQDPKSRARPLSFSDKLWISMQFIFWVSMLVQIVGVTIAISHQQGPKSTLIFEVTCLSM